MIVFREEKDARFLTDSNGQIMREGDSVVLSIRGTYHKVAEHKIHGRKLREVTMVIADPAETIQIIKY
ncbi:MAG: hypothetical protein WC119_02325 [Synergistaceae bacterium]